MLGFEAARLWSTALFRKMTALLIFEAQGIVESLSDSPLFAKFFPSSFSALIFRSLSKTDRVTFSFLGFFFSVSLSLLE